jgi:hypothetical protein
MAVFLWLLVLVFLEGKGAVTVGVLLVSPLHIMA